MDASGCGELLPWPTWPSWNYICLLKQSRFPSVQGFSCFADQAVLGALLAVEKPLRASECARCAPCPAPALLLHRRSWLLPPARVRLARLWLHYLHYGHAFALLPPGPGTGLWEGFRVNIHAPRCTGVLREGTEVRAPRLQEGFLTRALPSHAVHADPTAVGYLWGSAPTPGGDAL